MSEVDVQGTLNANGPFAVAKAAQVKGGYFPVADHAARDAIGVFLRLEGLLVQTLNDGNFWILAADLTTWNAFVLLPTLSGSDGAVLRETEPGATTAFQRLTQDDIDPAFAITAFSPGFTTTKELGDTIVNPGFTASYNATLTSLTLGDGTNVDPIGLAFENSFAYNDGVSGLPARSYVRSTINGTYTWTLTAHKLAGPIRTATTSAIWEARRYYDIQVVPGVYNQAFITGLVSNQLASGFSGSYAFGAGAPTKKIFIVWPTAFGNPATFKDQNGFIFPMSKVATAVAVTNAFAVVVPGGYDVWASDNFITSTFTITVS